ncbi:MAG: hypothetical protein WCK70_05960 [Chloroflexales bacterium]
MRRLPLILSMICAIVLSACVVPARAQTSTTPTLLKEMDVGDSQNDKYPNVTVSGQTVYIGGGVNNSDAYVWSFNEQATDIGPGSSIGKALSSVAKPDYATVAVATAPDGTIYAVWSSFYDRTLSIRHRDSSGAWGARHIIGTEVVNSYYFFPKVAVNSLGQVFVIWGTEKNIPLSLVVSNDEGVSWSSKYTTSVGIYNQSTSIAAGPNGQIAIGFTTDSLAPAIAIWTGSGLTTELLGSAKSGAQPGVSIGPDGKIYAAWRGFLPDGTATGAFYAERQGANNWTTPDHLFDGDVKNTFNVVVDSAGSVHLGWNVVIDIPRFFYSLRQAGQPDFSKAIPANKGPIYNSHFALSSGGSLVHVALENFSGTLPFITYARFSGATASSPPPTAAPKIENDAQSIKTPTSVSVSFTDVTNSPTEIRWRWGSAPTDTEYDSVGTAGWQTFSPTTTLTVAVPSTVSSTTTCLPVRLYTQVRTATKVAGLVQFDDVILDSKVTAAVRITNPHLRQVNLSPGSGARDGDPTYTRDPLVYVEAYGVNECSGLKELTFASSTPITVSNNFYAGMIPFPGTFATGSNTVTVSLTDKVGNSENYTQTLIYDTTPPVLDVASPGTVSATANLSDTVLASLQFSNITVTDTGGYPGRGFWGVWLANSRTPVTNPTTDTSLVWTPVAAPGTDKSFTISNWSLATGIPTAQRTAGDYTIYARFLDGAGNPTSGVISTTLNLSTITEPKVNLPFVRR